MLYKVLPSVTETETATSKRGSAAAAAAAAAAATIKDLCLNLVIFSAILSAMTLVNTFLISLQNL